MIYNLQNGDRSLILLLGKTLPNYLMFCYDFLKFTKCR